MKRLIFLVPLLFLLAPAAKAQEQGDPEAGRVYAEQTCASCHAIAPGDLYSPKQDATAFQRVADTPGMSVIALSVFLQTPHPTMPNLIIKSDDLHDVIAYIVSLKR
jgi:mono/diheme cytochrome c family protein